MKFGQLPNGEITIVDTETGLVYPASWYIPDHILILQDTNQTRHMLHELTEIEAEFAEYETEGTTFAESGSVKSIAAGFNAVAYKQKLKDGKAAFLSRNATSFPTVTQGMRPYHTDIIPMGVAYDINFFEQQAAARFGISIDVEGVQDCAEYIDNLLEEAWHKGGLNPEGLLVKGSFDWFNGGGANEIAAGTSIYKVALSTGDAGNTWALKTGNEIAVDVARGVEAVRVNSKNKATCNKIKLGLQANATLGEKFFVAEGGIAIPLRRYLKETYPDIMWVVSSYYDAIDFDGTPQETWDGNAGSGAVHFYADSPNNFKFLANRREILRPYEGPRGFQTAKVNTYGLTGGIQMRRTYTQAYMKGVR
jgi:hypothetical protein